MIQGVQYVVSLQDLNVSGQFFDLESKAMRFEESIESLNNTLRGLGAAWGAREVYEFGKSVIETGAKLESYRNLIKFASSDMADAAANQNEINKAVRDYKLPLMETYDQYSRFMAAVKGTPVEGNAARKTFDDLAMSLGVMHLPAERAARALYAVQEMFAEGRVQTRHFLRQLAPALPGITEAGAHVMHESIQEFIKQLGANPKSGKQISAYEFLPKLFAELRAEWEHNLPIAMQSLQANITDLDNAWLELKDDLAMKLKPEIIGLFDTLKQFIGWIKEHEDGLIRWGETIIKIGKAWIEYKVALALVNIAQNTYNGFMMGYMGQITATTSAYGMQAAAINGVTAAVERLNYQMAIANNMPTLAAMSAANAAKLGMGGAGGIVMQRPGSGILSAVTPVLLTAFGVEAVGQMLNLFPHSKLSGDSMSLTDLISWNLGFKKAAKLGAESGIWNAMQNALDKFYNKPNLQNAIIHKPALALDPSSYELINLVHKIQLNASKHGSLVDFEKMFLKTDNTGHTHAPTNAEIYEQLKSLKFRLPFLKDTTPAEGTGAGVKGESRIVPETDKVTGQHVITYNILQGGHISGIEHGTFELQDIKEFDMKQFAHNMAETIDALLNDSQIH